MKNKSNKRQSRLSKNVERIYSESVSLPYKILYFLTVPNVRLQLTLRNQTLDNTMQEELGKILGNKCRLPKNEHEIEDEFRRYIWELKILYGRDFKTRLYQYKQKHPDIDISAYGINSVFRVLQFIIYIVGSIAGGLNIADHVHSLLH